MSFEGRRQHLFLDAKTTSPQKLFRYWINDQGRGKNEWPLTKIFKNGSNRKIQCIEIYMYNMYVRVRHFFLFSSTGFIKF